jgi:hypothetical protein
MQTLAGSFTLPLCRDASAGGDTDSLCPAQYQTSPNTTSLIVAEPVHPVVHVAVMVNVCPAFDAIGLSNAFHVLPVTGSAVTLATTVYASTESSSPSGVTVTETVASPVCVAVPRNPYTAAIAGARWSTA